jgi:hypothetical protein
LLLLAGCGGKTRPVDYENLTPKLGAVEFTHITVDLSRTRAELLVVLRRNNPGRKLRLPPIDYARQETYLVATGPRSSTGYALRIVRVEQKGDHIDVVVHEQTPALGDPVRARVTYPFLLLALDSHKPVHLRWPGRP